MSLEGIQKKILAAGEKEGAEILAQARKERENLLKEAEEKLVGVRAQAEKESKRAREEILERARIEAELEARNKILKNKQDLLDQVFVAVAQHLSKLEGKEREKVLASLLAEAVQGFGAKDAYITAVKKDGGILRDLVQNYPGLKLAARSIGGEGGFVIANSETEQDFTFQNLIAERREKLEGEVAKILFT